MGGKCSPSGGITPIYSDEINNIKDIHGKPNSRTDLYNKAGELIQSRWFGSDGWAMWDRHFVHSDSLGTHEFPHDHGWGWMQKRGASKFFAVEATITQS